MNTQKNIPIRLIISLFVIIIISSCAAGQTPDLEDPLFKAALETAVGGAVASQAAEFEKTQAAFYATETLAAFSATDTPVAIAATDTPAPSPTPQPATLTLEPISTPVPVLGQGNLPRVSVSVDTNCRSGPGKAYLFQAGFLVGEEATVHGRDDSGTWLYISHPEVPSGFCWIWGKYASTSSNVAYLPVFTPGPTPDTRPDFKAKFHELENCSGKWIVEFTIQNTGSVPLQSVSVHVKNTENSESGKVQMNSFKAQNDCDIILNQGRLDLWTSGYTISRSFTNDPSGDLCYATITICSEEDLAIPCQKKEFTFKP